jgi:hypothetical protein
MLPSRRKAQRTARVSFMFSFKGCNGLAPHCSLERNLSSADSTATPAIVTRLPHLEVCAVTCILLTSNRRETDFPAAVVTSAAYLAAGHVPSRYTLM